jgi:hypothetical protein
MIPLTDPFLLYGTRDVEPRPIRLDAGRLTADLSGGNLRTIAYDGIEVLRGISYLVRDRDWGTYSPSITDLDVNQQDDAFSVSYAARCSGPEGSDLSIQVRISAEGGNRLIFEAEAISTSGFETNRCGFCILHPIVGIAGTAAIVEHVDAQRRETHFPDLIEPWQPFKDMRAITHTVMSKVTAECRMEGDTFEMEDQRNWSDASYKTYVRPLALPWPYRIAPGEPLRQRIVLTITDRRASAASPSSPRQTAEAIAITAGTRGGKMPSIGLIITPEEARATLAARRVLADIDPQELLFHFDPLAGHDAGAFEDFASIAALHSGTTTVEIALPCRQSPASETREIAEQMRAAGFLPAAVVISPSVDRQSTPPGSKWPQCPPLEEVYAAARTAFPTVRLGGGMLSYFTELNRKRVPSEPIDFITHCTNPIVHAADDLRVMQTLEALPFITRSVRAIYGGKPYRIGPSTIPMRQNPYGSRTMDNPDGARIAMANADPRHNGLFAEAFALGYVARVLDAELDCLTLSALTGPSGVIAGKGEPVGEGGMRPIFSAIKSLAAVACAEWQECISSAPDQLLAFATKADIDTGMRLWLVNVTSSDQRADLSSYRLPPDRVGTIVTLAPYATTAVSFAP